MPRSSHRPSTTDKAGNRLSLSLRQPGEVACHPAGRRAIWRWQVGKLLRHAPRFVRGDSVPHRVHRIRVAARLKVAKPLAAGVIDTIESLLRSRAGESCEELTFDEKIPARRGPAGTSSDTRQQSSHLACFQCRGCEPALDWSCETKIDLAEIGKAKISAVPGGGVGSPFVTSLSISSS
jgi:hypothetical protein